MREYEITRNGIRLTVLLTEEDAKQAGAVPVAVKPERVASKARKPVNKARIVENK